MQENLNNKLKEQKDIQEIQNRNEHKGSPKGMLTSKLDRINFIYCDHNDDPDVDVDQQTTPNHLCSHTTYCSERIYGENRRQ